VLAFWRQYEIVSIAPLAPPFVVVRHLACGVSAVRATAGGGRGAQVRPRDVDPRVVAVLNDELARVLARPARAHVHVRAVAHALVR
jgi:hypothetical protein